MSRRFINFDSFMSSSHVLESAVEYMVYIGTLEIPRCRPLQAKCVPGKPEIPGPLFLPYSHHTTDRRVSPECKTVGSELTGCCLDQLDNPVLTSIKYTFFRICLGKDVSANTFHNGDRVHLSMNACLGSPCGTQRQYSGHNSELMHSCLER